MSNLQPRDKYGRFTSNVKKAKIVMPKPATPKIIDVALLIDMSSSMSHITKHCENSVRSILDSFKQSEKKDVKYRVSLYTFGNEKDFKILMSNETDYTNKTFSFDANGATALLYSVNKATENLLATNGDSKLLICLTDGYENASYSMKRGDFADFIKGINSREDISLTFQVPNIGSRDYLTYFGIPQGNISIWDATLDGMKKADQEIKTSGVLFLNNVSRGINKTVNFYADIDLGKLKTKQVQNKLNDVTSKVKLYEVEKEQPIKEFVEQKTKRNYVIGSTFMNS